MKMTFNRQLILSVLTEEYEGSLPPHSAGMVGYMLEAAFENQWEGIYQQMKIIPNKQQIYRTLKELWNEGLIVGTRVKETQSSNLPCWVVWYQLSADMFKNSLITECASVYRQVDKAKNGLNFFGSVMDKGLPAEEVEPLVIRVKDLLQRTDKSPGYAIQNEQMIKCMALLKSGIPLPKVA
jgi:hypothetical protein